MKIAAILSVLLFLSLPASAQEQPDLDDYHLLLVPVFSFGPGAHGSQWETSVSVASVEEDATMPVPILTDDASDCRNLNGVIRDSSVRYVCPGFASPSGLFLHVPKTLELHQFYATSRVRDLTRQAFSAGTAIPVVRESEFRSTEILLLDIPSDARFRSNLRVYAGPWSITSDRRFINTIQQSVSIDIYDSRSLGTFPALASFELDLSAASVIDGSPYYVRPGYASIGNLIAAFPQLANVPSYTIRIRTGQPLTSPPVTLTTWAFVSITNNDTQEVTIVTP